MIDSGKPWDELQLKCQARSRKYLVYRRALCCSVIRILLDNIPEHVYLLVRRWDNHLLEVSVPAAHGGQLLQAKLHRLVHVLHDYGRPLLGSRCVQDVAPSVVGRVESRALGVSSSRDRMPSQGICSIMRGRAASCPKLFSSHRKKSQPSPAFVFADDEPALEPLDPARDVANLCAENVQRCLKMVKSW